MNAEKAKREYSARNKVRRLARRALNERVIDVITWEFIDTDPDRAGECSEFVEWLEDLEENESFE